VGGKGQMGRRPLRKGEMPSRFCQAPEVQGRAGVVRCWWTEGTRGEKEKGDAFPERRTERDTREVQKLKRATRPVLNEIFWDGERQLSRREQTAEARGPGRIGLVQNCRSGEMISKDFIDRRGGRKL